MKKVVFVFSFLSFLLTLPIFILSFFPVTKIMYHLTDVRRSQSEKLTQVSDDALRQTLNYLFNDEKTYQLDFPDTTNFQLTINEQSHMADVKRLFSIVKYFFVMNIIVTIVLFSTTKNKKIMLQNFVKSCKFLLPSIALISLAVVFIWDQSFTIFHQIFFPQGNWAFPADTLIIQLFPDQFWWGMGVGYLWLVGGEIGITVLISQLKN